jgi:hypothetical protein
MRRRLHLHTEKKDLDKKEKTKGFEHGSSCLATPVTVVLKEKKRRDESPVSKHIDFVACSMKKRESDKLVCK